MNYCSGYSRGTDAVNPFRKTLLAVAIAMALALVAWAVQTIRDEQPDLAARLYLAMAVAGVVALLLLLLLLGAHSAGARDLGQWARSDPISQWYQTLMQPDNPAVSCCGEADAYWADSYEVSKDGEYIAIITDERADEPLKRPHKDVGTRIVIPKHKLKWDQSNPTGHGVVFLSRGDFVWCYVAPGGV